MRIKFVHYRGKYIGLYFIFVLTMKCNVLKQYKLIKVIYKVMTDKLSVLRNVIMKPFYCHNVIIMGFRAALFIL